MHCDLDLWPFDLKIYRAHPWLMGSLHVKFHDDRCKGKAVMRRKPKCGRQMDGQTDMVIPVYPPNFVAGGINIQNKKFKDYKLKFQRRSLKFKDFSRTNSFSRSFQGKPKIQGVFKDCGNPVITVIHYFVNHVFKNVPMACLLTLQW